MPLSLLNHSALALFAQRTRIPTSARSIGFCAIWVCISSSSSSMFDFQKRQMESNFLQQAPIYGRSCGKGGEMRGFIQIEQLGRVILGVKKPIIWVFFIWVINPALH